MSGLIPVSQALDAIFKLVSPTNTEDVRIENAHGRVLAKPMQANRSQPPFASAAMAVRDRSTLFLSSDDMVTFKLGLPFDRNRSLDVHSNARGASNPRYQR